MSNVDPERKGRVRGRRGDACVAPTSVGIDIGGTFTDLMMVHPRTGERVVEKVLTTPKNPGLGVLDGLLKLLTRAGMAVSDLHAIAHATTLATNTIIEGTGARVGLITTKGFRDTLEIGTESRYDLYDLELVLPPPLVPRRLRREVDERIGADGQVVSPLDPGEVRGVLDWFRDQGIKDIAVCLLHSYANPEHERLIRKVAAESGDGFTLSLSSELCPEIREYPRTSTTVINAYVRPRINSYLEHLEGRLREQRFRGSLFIMSSAGGVLHPESARATPACLVESGPAAGALAAGHFGRTTGRRRVLGFDMGGTTAKACLVFDGRPSLSREFEAARVKRFLRGSGYPIRLPAVELIEIGAGGGSIARVDSMGLLKVGPAGAGADPGPACYGRGGSLPTVTDADLLLGYLDPSYFLGGQMRLHLEAAERALQDEIARPLGMPLTKAAWGVFEVVNENMAAAAAIHTIERGFDPRGFSLMAFGGAGPVHAYRVAKRLGIREVIFPIAAGVASAAGLLAAPAASHHVRTFVRPLDGITEEELSKLFRELEEEGRRSLDRLSVTRYARYRMLEMRYVGQGHEIEVRLPPARPGRWLAAIRRAFESQYVRLFGHLPGDLPIEIINCRLTVSGRAQEVDVSPPVAAARREPLKGHRRAFFQEAGGFVPAAVLARDFLSPGEIVEGPSIIEEPESTVIVPPGHRCTVDGYGNLIMTGGKRIANGE